MATQLTPTKASTKIPSSSPFHFNGNSNEQTVTFDFTSGNSLQTPANSTTSPPPPFLVPDDTDDENRSKNRRITANKRKRGIKHRNTNSARIRRSNQNGPAKNFSFPIVCPIGPIRSLPVLPAGPADKKNEAVVPEWYTAAVPLGVKDDKTFLYGLHTYMRSHLLEAFGADGNDKQASNIGRVGIRCRCCHGASMGINTAVKFPSSISEIYPCAQSLFTEHFPVCTHVPPDVRKEVDSLTKNHKGNLGPREWYWEDSARMLGMIDVGESAGEGVYFGRDPRGDLCKLRGASAAFMAYDEDCTKDDTTGGAVRKEQKPQEAVKRIAGRPILMKMSALPYIYTGGDNDHSSGNVPKDLVHVIVHDSVTHIDGCAFQNCKTLTSVQISDSVTSIGVKAFEGCTNLTNVRLPPGLMCIGHEAFSGCVCLADIRLPDGLARIEDRAFYRCESLPVVSTVSDNADMVMEDTAVGAERCRNLPKDNHLDFTAQVTSNVYSLGEDAFTFCTSLTKVTLPSRITTIGERAFFGCDALKSVQLPASLIGFSVNAFEGCTELDTIDGFSTSKPSSLTSSAFILHIIPPYDSDDDDENDDDQSNDSNPRVTQLTFKLHKALTLAGYSTLNLSSLLKPNPNVASQPATHYYHTSIWPTWTRLNSSTSGRIPLGTAVSSPCTDWKSASKIFRENMPGLYEDDSKVTGLPLFGLAAAGVDGDLEVSYRLLKEFPPAIVGCGWTRVDDDETGRSDGIEDMDWD